jgi:glucokinase
MKKYAGIDIGGTSIKYGIVDQNGKVICHWEIPTQAEQGGLGIVKNVIALIDSLMKMDLLISGIGISTAGVVDSDKGEILYANENLPCYTGTQWKEIINSKYGLNCSVHNDVNAAALAESWVGAAKGLKNFFCMTIGTGIGGSVFLDGELYKGSHNQAAEIGYMSTDGKAEWLEKKASTSALIKKVQNELNVDDADGKKIFSRARENVDGYRLILDEWIDEVAKGIANVIYLFDPGVIVIGGGISNEKEYLTDKISERLHRKMPEGFMRETVIKTAQCGNDAGIIGAVFEMTKG